MEFFDFAGYIFILKGGSLVICQGIQIPIVLDTILNVSYKTLFHCFCTFGIKLRKYSN